MRNNLIKVLISDLRNSPIYFQGIKITSTKTVVPYEYYSLPFCRPQGAIHYISENLGEVMRGDRIVNTPFAVSFKIYW